MGSIADVRATPGQHRNGMPGNSSNSLGPENREKSASLSLREMLGMSGNCRGSDYESEGRTFESFRARHSRHRFASRFAFLLGVLAVLVCSWFANFVRGLFSKLKIACSASPRVRARYRSRMRCTVFKL